MAFPKFEFTKRWTNQSDFPTTETNETAVRNDMQLLFDECKAAIHNLIDLLTGSTAAENIGTASGGKVQDTITKFESMSVTDAIGGTPGNTKLPTEKAVNDAINAKITEIGAGDMAAATYDPGGKETDVFGYVDAHTGNTNNPHGVTKAQIGLSNVDNKSEATIKSDFTGSLAADNDGFVKGGEVKTALDGKSPTTHNHDTAYSAKSHNHDGTYSPVSHNHSGVYSQTNHTHSGYSATGHTHDDRYYTESEMNTKLSGKETAGTCLPKSGGTMTGGVTLKGITLTSGTDYGTSLPSSAPAGKLFFKKA